MSSPPDLPACRRHPDRQTRLACSSCDTPACVDCLTPVSVGQLCPDCRAARGTQRQVEVGGSARAATGRAPVSTTILVTAVVIFVVGLLSPTVRQLSFIYGAQLNRVVAAGEWWRLVTAGFLHADLAHILFNMWALYILGPQLERSVGSAAFAGLYVAALLSGGAAFFLLNPEGQAVGASGAIFGLFGAWLVIAFRNRRSAWGRAGFNQLLVLLGINLALPLFIPRIAWQAHLGGLLAGGLIAALWTTPFMRGPGRRRQRILSAVAIAAVALTSVLLASPMP